MIINGDGDEWGAGKTTADGDRTKAAIVKAGREQSGPQTPRRARETRITIESRKELSEVMRGRCR